MDTRSVVIPVLDSGSEVVGEPDISVDSSVDDGLLLNSTVVDSGSKDVVGPDDSVDSSVEDILLVDTPVVDSSSD